MKTLEEKEETKRAASEKRKVLCKYGDRIKKKKNSFDVLMSMYCVAEIIIIDCYIVKLAC